MYKKLKSLKSDWRSSQQSLKDFGKNTKELAGWKVMVKEKSCSTKAAAFEECGNKQAEERRARIFKVTVFMLKSHSESQKTFYQIE